METILHPNVVDAISRGELHRNWRAMRKRIEAAEGEWQLCFVSKPENNGPGVAEDERNLIFQRFWRRDRRKAGSTGLGLSIVQRIAELHSATVTLENRRPAGARFYVDIPATVAAEAEARA